VGGQKDRGVPQLLEHLEQASASDWVNACRWLVQELDLRICDQRQGTAKLAFVAATKFACLLITEWS
jgi:hypothetical protein